MVLQIRGITFDDIDEITELYIETYKKEPWKENWNKKITREKIKNAIGNNISENYCMNKDNKIIGVMFAHRNYYIDRKELYIDEFFIEYNDQRKGKIFFGKY